MLNENNSIRSRFNRFGWLKGLAVAGTSAGIATSILSVGIAVSNIQLTRILVTSTYLLTLGLSILFVAGRPRPDSPDEQTIVVGDDFQYISYITEVVDQPIIGYVSPPNENEQERVKEKCPVKKERQIIADGGTQQLNGSSRLGDLSDLGEVISENNVDKVVMAFQTSDRAGFFRVLRTCYEKEIAAEVPQDRLDSILTKSDSADSGLVKIAVEPWGKLDLILKRLFDVLFALFGIVAFAPIVGVIALAIKLDSPGPILYKQERTAQFGGTFPVYKFRSMITDAEAETGAKVSEEDKGEVDPRVTRVGRVLRQTHLDEIPQLWSILVGEMSVIGPRPERPEIDAEIETEVVGWRKRWFVKPGLTGLAQISDATGYEPAKKLQYDVEYIRRQSFWLDLKIVGRQIWQVIQDTFRLSSPRE